MAERKRVKIKAISKNSILFAVVLCAVLCAVAAPGANLVVGPDGFASIQQAINASVNGDTITAGLGTYRENINFLGKAITLTSTNPDDPDIVAATIIDGSAPSDPDNGSTVTFNHGETNSAILRGFTITGGSGSWLVIAWRFHAPYWNRCGGGVVCYNKSAPVITKNVITGNLAGEGGGVYVYGEPVNINKPANPAQHIKPVISGNTFADNRAIKEHGCSPPDNSYVFAEHGDGGAIVCFQGVDADIADNIFENNQADFYGGAIHLRQWSNGQITGNRIANNSSLLGAGIHITYTSSPLVRKNIIEDNNATSLGGGGLYIYFYSNPIVENNIIRRNSSSSAAGIGVYWTSRPIIRSNLIVDNLLGPGVLAAGGAVPKITNNTITGNAGGGVDITSSYPDPADVPVITNNIITGNGNSYGVYSSLAAPIIRYNDVWGNGKGNYNPVIGDQTGINGNISQDPNFVSPGNFHILLLSPCLDAGDPAAAGLSTQTDIDGEQRLFGTRVDIGADEAVKNIADFNTDGTVDVLDLLLITKPWLAVPTDMKYDISGDNFIDIEDFAVFAGQWLWKAGWYK